MEMTVIEKILASHSGRGKVKPGDIVDVRIDARAARDFGGANVVKNMRDHGLSLEDVSKTFFTFDCNPTGSDQKYAANQQHCRIYAREEGITIYDIDRGIGTHLLMEEGLVWPGSTMVSTDSHANIVGAVGAFGQGMGDKDIAASWHSGSSWFKVPQSVKIHFEKRCKPSVSAKDIALNLLHHFGSSSLLGCAVEVEGELIDGLSLDQRITIASMATEMGAIILLFPPNEEILNFCSSVKGSRVEALRADADANYREVFTVDASTFLPRISRPGKPHDTTTLPADPVWIDSAFIGSCTNGRMEDMRIAAALLKGRHVAPGVVLKIVPATNGIWEQCLEEGLIKIFKEAGALLSNAGCAGCAAGQVGQNGPGEITISTGNRNFPGKQGHGEVYLASPAVVAASAVAGYICEESSLPDTPAQRPAPESRGLLYQAPVQEHKTAEEKAEEVEGRVWYIPRDDIDTDMIYHNRYLSVTERSEMGQYTFDNLEGYRDFASRVRDGDIVVAGRNFGSGSSRQQAVDCFLALGVNCLLAESFGAIYERNAINAAFPILAAAQLSSLELEDGDRLRVNFRTGDLTNLSKGLSIPGEAFSEVQMEIYKNDGLF